MPTYYIDFEGGNDANAGTSFATRWKTFTNGATAARIAPGDDIRVMASPNPTSIGNATWTSGPIPTAINISSSTNATPIVITTSAAHGLVTGDYVAIASHTTNTNANGVWQVGTIPTGTTFQILQMGGANTTGNGVGGASGSIRNVDAAIVKLASLLTQNIALCGGLGQKPAWVASTNVIVTQNITTWKEGYSSASVAPLAAFTTGKAAYYTLPATLNLSSYQQVSFWINQTAGTLSAAGACYVALCSDTIGNTVVHQCNIPAFTALNTWTPVVVDFGANLNNAIQSVAFYVVTDNGAQTFLLDNIIACKAASSADSLNLTSLIGKNTGTESWYALQSINSDAVMIGATNALVATNSNNRGYYGTSGTVATSKRETIKLPPGTSASTTNTFTDSGTAGSLITYSGGWNRTDMSTQTGETWYDGQNGLAYCYNINTRSFISLDKLNAVRFNYAASISSGNFNQVGTMYGVSCGLYGFYFSGGGSNNLISTLYSNGTGQGLALSGAGNTITTAYLSSCASNAVTTFTNGTGGYNTTIGTLNSYNNNGSALEISVGDNLTVGTLNTGYNINYAISGLSGITHVNGGSSVGNVSGVGINTDFVSSGSLYLNNFTINDTLEVNFVVPVGAVYSNRNDNTDNNSWVFQPNGTINQQTSVVDSPATTSWKMNPTNSDASSTNPLSLKIGTVVCASGSLVTITARLRRDNTGLTMRLVCPGGQITGVASDVTSDMTAAANTWQTVTITFTPTKAGAVDIYAYAFGGTTNSGYVCNLTASQA